MSQANELIAKRSRPVLGQEALLTSGLAKTSARDSSMNLVYLLVWDKPAKLHTTAISALQRVGMRDRALIVRLFSDPTSEVAYNEVNILTTSNSTFHSINGENKPSREY